MQFVYDEMKQNISKEIKNAIENRVIKLLNEYFDLSKGYLERIQFVSTNFFNNNVAAVAEPANRLIILNFDDWMQVVENNYSDIHEEYRSVANTLLHEYVHLENYYHDLLGYMEYINKQGTDAVINIALNILVDEYIATYRSGKFMFSKNEIHKILPSMCECVSQNRGKKDIQLFGQVLQSLAIGIAYDCLVQEREGISQVVQDTDKDEVIEYKELILGVRNILIKFEKSRKLELTETLKEYVEELCEIFGMDRMYRLRLGNV